MQLKSEKKYTSFQTKYSGRTLRGQPQCFGSQSSMLVSIINHQVTVNSCDAVWKLVQ